MKSNVFNIIISIVAAVITIYFVRGIIKDSRRNYDKLNDHRRDQNL